MTKNVYQNMEEAQGIVIDFAAIFRSMIRNASLILLCGLLGALLLFVKTNRGEEYSYTATTLTCVRNIGTENDPNSISSGDTTASQALVKVYSGVLTKNERFLKEVLNTALLSDKYKPKTLGSAIKATAVNSTQLMNISVTMSNPKDAYHLARAIESVAPVILPELVAGSSITVMSSAIFPTDSTTKNLKKSIIMGALLGIFFGCCLVAFFEVMDRRLKSALQLRLTCGAEIAGRIPAAGRTEVRYPRTGSAPVSEEWRRTRAALRSKGIADKKNVLVLTGPMGKEGVTTAAHSLAAAFSEIGMKSIVLDGSVRRGGNAGLSDVLAGKKEYRSVLEKQADGLYDLLPAGTKCDDPSVLFESDAFTALLEALRESYDLVLIDIPAAERYPEALIAAIRCDGVIAVVRNGRTNLDRVSHMIRELKAVNVEAPCVIYNETGDCVL